MTYWKPTIEIAILFVIFYVILRFMRGSRGEGILKGIIFIFLVIYGLLLYFAKNFHLEQLDFLLSNLLTFSVFGLLIIFQPELRRGLIRVGTPWGKVTSQGGSILEELIQAVLRMSKQKIGALIALEADVGLKSYIEGGIELDALLNNELLETIFYPGTALHDGAVIIRGDRIAAASCLFPLTESTDLAKDLGTRHRAGVGVTEESDAVVIIVSEETGAISLAYRGKLHKNIDRESLVKLLNEFHLGR